MKSGGDYSIRPLGETGEHSYHRRAEKHNYHAPFIYHIILKKQENCEPFGRVIGDPKILYGHPGCANISESPLGRLIAKSILGLPYNFNILFLHQFKVMPDHVHFIIQVMDWSEEALDYYIEQLVKGIAKKYSRLRGQEIGHEEIFVKGFCDKPLLWERSLNGWYAYIKQNPHRLAIRQQYPEFFKRKRNLKIGEREYDAYGNLFLFRNPDKVAVKISHKLTYFEKETKINYLIEASNKGTILVSPFINQEEKEIRRAAEENGGRIILIKHETLEERFKPFKHDFDLCSQGRLLIISLGYPKGTPISKKICEEMNELALFIASAY